MDEIGKEINAWFLPHVKADPKLFRRGESPVPALRYFSQRTGAGQLRVVTQPVEHGDVEALMNVITEKFRSYPGMRAFAARGSIITSNNGGTRSINLDISGPDLDTIYRVAQLADEQPNILPLAYEHLAESDQAWQRLSARLGTTVSGDEFENCNADCTEENDADPGLLNECRSLYRHLLSQNEQKTC